MDDMTEALQRRISYFGGHSDTTAMLADAAFLRVLVDALAAPFRTQGVTKVAGIEARGLALAAGVALTLGAGFVPVRKRGGVHPGPKVEATAAPNWRGQATQLRIQRHALAPGDRVLLVDDWAETGSGAITARELIERCGAQFVGFALVVDQLPDATRTRLDPVRALARASDLTPDRLIGA